MIIVLKPGLSDDQLHAIEDHVKRAGASPVLIEGKERSVVAVIGAAKLETALFEQLPGVAQVMRISKSYKLASREVKREDTIVRIGRRRHRRRAGRRHGRPLLGRKPEDAPRIRPAPLGHRA